VLLYLFPVSDHLVTRMYFPDAVAALAGDTVLAAVPAERQHTPIATATGRGLQFDIRAQGGEETVFFE
jgi:protocatechuate 3,4-dioxygenase, alpha subunit